MKTDVIAITSSGNNMGSALAQIDKLSAFKGLSPKSAMQLRLLAEETMCLMRAITGGANGEFWVEDEDGVYEMHLLVTTLMDEEMRRQLLSTATSGKNEATRGFMGKLRAFFEPTNCIPTFSAGFHGAGSLQTYGSYVWSMEDYRDQLRQYERQHQGADTRAAWDELEKSVVARVADDVKVYISGTTVEMTIFKRLA